LWTLTPRRRTGLWPASVFSSNLNARAAMLSGAAVGSAVLLLRVIVVKSD
jgi:hypothetical protein